MVFASFHSQATESNDNPQHPPQFRTGKRFELLIWMLLSHKPLTSLYLMDICLRGRASLRQDTWLTSEVEVKVLKFALRVFLVLWVRVVGAGLHDSCIYKAYP